MGEMGFGKRTGIDIHEESTALMPDRGWKRARFNEPWYQGETLSVGIGQSFWTVTPLQLATSTNIIATEGRRITPRLLRATEHQGTFTLVEPIENLPIELTNPQHWHTIKKSMARTITHIRGTARTAFLNSTYTSAGKTGTAQVVALSDETDERPDIEDVAERFRDNATYIGFAPAENPEIVVALAIENVGGGGRNAAPVSRAIMDYYFADEQTKQEILATIRSEREHADN